MSNRVRKTTSPVKITCFKDLELLFGPPPILEGDDPAAYRMIGQSIWDAWQPRDFIEMMWVNDVAYLLTEGIRLRRMKGKLIDGSRIEGVSKLIRRLTGQYFDGSYWSDWALGNKENVEFVESIFCQAGFDDKAVVAQTIAVVIDTIDKIERQSSQFEARRLVTIRDFSHYRELSDQRLERMTRDDRKFQAEHDQNYNTISQGNKNVGARQ